SICSGFRLLLRPIYPLAQNLHVRLQPTWDDTQAVIRSGAGIKTPSIRCASCKIKEFFIVLSALNCELLIFTLLIIKFSASLVRSSFEILLISSKEMHDFSHSHS